MRGGSVASAPSFVLAAAPRAISRAASASISTAVSTESQRQAISRSLKFDASI